MERHTNKKIEIHRNINRYLYSERGWRNERGVLRVNVCERDIERVDDDIVASTVVAFVAIFCDGILKTGLNYKISTFGTMER